MTDGYVIDNVYLDWFTTESPKTAPTSQQPSPEEDVSEASGDTSDEDETFGVFQYGGAATTATPKAWSPEQPLLESNKSELLEGSGDTTDVSIFFQNGSKHDVSTTVNVSPDWSTDQSNETDLLEGSGDVFDVSIFFQNGSKYDVSTTESVSPDWSAYHVPTEILLYDYDYLEGLEDVSNTSVVLQHGGEHDVATTTSVSPDWSADQSNESDLLEESRDVSDVSSFLQQGRKHDVSTTTSVVAAWSTQQPSTESTESDSLTGSGDATDLHIFSQREPQPDESTTAGAAHTRSPSTAALPGDADGSGSGDVWPSDAEIIHTTTSSSVGVSSTDTSTTSPISTPILRGNFHPIERQNVVNLGASNLQSGKLTEEQSSKHDCNYSFISLVIYCVFLFFSVPPEPQTKDSSLPSNNGARTPGLCRKSPCFRINGGVSKPLFSVLQAGSSSLLSLLVSLH